MDERLSAPPILWLPTSEWEGTFRDDISSYLDDVLIEQAIDLNRPLELPPRAGVSYKAYTDAAGGTGGDAYTLAIGHVDNDELIIDVIRGTKGKYDPHNITAEYAKLLKEYRIQEVTGDFYAAEWVSSTWSKSSISYNRSELPRSQIYLEAAPLFARGVVRLPNHPKLLRELRLLEKRPHRSGKDTVDHGRNGNDDHSNSVCGVLRLLSANKGYDPCSESFYRAWLDGFVDEPSPEEVKRRREAEEYRKHLLETIGAPVSLNFGRVKRKDDD